MGAVFGVSNYFLPLYYHLGQDEVEDEEVARLYVFDSGGVGYLSSRPSTRHSSTGSKPSTVASAAMELRAGVGVRVEARLRVGAKEMATHRPHRPPWRSSKYPPSSSSIGVVTESVPE